VTGWWNNSADRFPPTISILTRAFRLGSIHLFDEQGHEPLEENRPLSTEGDLCIVGRLLEKRLECDQGLFGVSFQVPGRMANLADGLTLYGGQENPSVRRPQRALEVFSLDARQ
jgi:hypothetical protein